MFIPVWEQFQKNPETLDAILPYDTNLVDLKKSFGQFSVKKNFQIQPLLQSSSPILVIRPSHIKNTLSSFTLVSEDDVLKILVSYKTKTCDRNPIPT